MVPFNVGGHLRVSTPQGPRDPYLGALNFLPPGAMRTESALSTLTTDSFNPPG